MNKLEFVIAEFSKVLSTTEKTENIYSDKGSLEGIYFSLDAKTMKGYDGEVYLGLSIRCEILNQDLKYSYFNI